MSAPSAAETFVTEVGHDIGVYAVVGPTAHEAWFFIESAFSSRSTRVDRMRREVVLGNGRRVMALGADNLMRLRAYDLDGALLLGVDPVPPEVSFACRCGPIFLAETW